MKLTLHQLNVFQVVAERGSVTSAANYLHMTQPGVSNILRQLEAYYECPLTQVVGRKLHLTGFGKALLAGCTQIKIDLAKIQNEIEGLKGCIAGTLRVATVSTAKYFAPHLLGKFKETHPDIKINLVVKNRQEIIDRLHGNLDDFVIMSHPPQEIPVDYADFYKDQLVIAASKDFHAPGSQQLDLAYLSEAPWIVREIGSGTRFATEKLFRKNKFYPKVVMEISDSEAIKQALIANIGISVISKQSIQSELRDGILKALPINGFPLPHDWYLVKNRGVSLSPIAESFYALVNQHQPIFNKTN